jgi:hypothetical protein
MSQLERGSPTKQEKSRSFGPLLAAIVASVALSSWAAFVPATPPRQLSVGPTSQRLVSLCDEPVISSSVICEQHAMLRS